VAQCQIPVEKLKLLNDAKKAVLFKEHPENYFFSRASGDTKHINAINEQITNIETRLRSIPSR